MITPLVLPKLYAIVDRETLDARGLSVPAFAEELRAGGVRLVQYRDKKNGPEEVLRAARGIWEVFVGTDAMLILNDNAELAGRLGWGCHVGQGDLGVELSRRLVGPEATLGLSTHTAEQVTAANEAGCDYIATGPVFGTMTKADASPVVGLAGVRQARALTAKPLVAIGGISLENVRSVVDAGADSVALISGLLVQGRAVRDVARDFLEILR